MTDFQTTVPKGALLVDAPPDPALDDLYEEIASADLTPGWMVNGLWSEPTTDFRPMRWRYEDARRALDHAGERPELSSVIKGSVAERRNLIMRNPFEGNVFATTRTLVAVYQQLMPGEVAAAHRHSPHAFRVLIDVEDCYSVVDGVRVPMNSGDVVLTPGGRWHGHGHEGDRPAYWLDGLDVPLVQLLEPMHFERYPEPQQPSVEVTTESPYYFPAQRIEDALDKAAPGPDGVHGPRITLPTPEMPSMALSMERLEAGASTRAHRSNANRVFTIMAGSGSTVVDDETFTWTRGDTIVVPTWSRYHHAATSDSTLFGYTDEPTMRVLNYYREEGDLT